MNSDMINTLRNASFRALDIGDGFKEENGEKAISGPGDIDAVLVTWKKVKAGSDGCQCGKDETAKQAEDQEQDKKEEKVLVIAFRGTQGLGKQPLDWMQNLSMALVPFREGRVHQGFDLAVNRLIDPLKEQIEEDLSAADRIAFTGHSKGAAMATLAAMILQPWIRERQQGLPIDVCSFGSPRVGDTLFAAGYNRMFPEHRRIEEFDDLVPHLPLSRTEAALLPVMGPMFIAAEAAGTEFCHVGKRYVISRSSGAPELLKASNCTRANIEFELAGDRRCYRLEGDGTESLSSLSAVVDYLYQYIGVEAMTAVVDFLSRRTDVEELAEVMPSLMERHTDYSLES